MSQKTAPSKTDEEKFLEMLREDQAKALAGTSPYPPSLAHPRAWAGTAAPSLTNQNVFAYVMRDAANLVNVPGQLGASKLKNVPQLVGHELEHVLQYGRPKDFYESVGDEYVRMGGTRHELDKHLNRIGRNEQLFEEMKQLKPDTFTSAYLGRWPGNPGVKELFAELSAIEHLLRKDLTKHPGIRKQFFADDEKLISVYKASTGLRLTRTDARDLPPQTAQPIEEKNFLDRVREYFK